MFQFLKKQCTEKIKGTLIEKRWNGDVWYLKAKYVVDGKSYTCSEELRYIMKDKKQRRRNGVEATANLGNIHEGEPVWIQYNPKHPSQSFMPENEGIKFS